MATLLSDLATMAEGTPDYDNTILQRVPLKVAAWLESKELPTTLGDWHYLYCSEDGELSSEQADVYDHALGAGFVMDDTIDRHQPTGEYTVVSLHVLGTATVIGVGVGCSLCSAIMSYYTTDANIASRINSLT